MAPTSKSYHLFVWSRELRGLSSIRSIPQMLPNFFCEGPCSKYFKICRPHSLCSNYFMLQYEASCLLFSCEVMSNSLWCHGLQHTRLLFHSLSPRVPSNSYPLSQWCYLTISSSAAPFPFAFNLSLHQGPFREGDFGPNLQPDAAGKLQRVKHSSVFILTRGKEAGFLWPKPISYWLRPAQRDSYLGPFRSWSLWGKGLQ